MSESKASNNPKILLLYDQGGIKDLLFNCMSQNNYNVYHADTLEKAENIMYSNPDISVVITSIKVNGLDVVSIMHKLTLVAPDIIAIICTDVIDFRKLTSIINKAPIYKILTFPLDVDTELIPAIGELQVTTMSMKADRNDMYSVLQQNENLSEKLEEVQQLCKMQLGARRELYEIVNTSMDICSKILCQDLPQNTFCRLSAFQKYITKHFFLNLNPREQSMNVIADQIIKVFDNPTSNKHASIYIEGTDACRDLLRSKVTFVILLLFYRLTLYENDYYVSASVSFKSENMASIKVTYRFEDGVWQAMNSDSLQKSYTATIESLIKSECKDFVQRTDSNSVIYSLNIIE